MKAKLPMNPLAVSLKDSDALMWHHHLVHISLKRIIKMCLSGELLGLPTRLNNKYFIYEDCLDSKSMSQCGSRLSNNRKLQSMNIMLSYLLGPFVEGFSGVQYIVFFLGFGKQLLRRFPFEEQK